MIFRNVLLACVYIFASFNISNIGYAEPMIILKYSNQNEVSGGDGKNPFSIDPNYAENYSVKSGDSLNSILGKFYRGSGLDWRFVQLSIVIANPSAFAKNNPNFLFSGTTVYLPGKADIAKLLLGEKVGKNNSNQNDPSQTKSIYFFGG
jgi:hypothetical protein